MTTQEEMAAEIAYLKALCNQERARGDKAEKRCEELNDAMNRSDADLKEALKSCAAMSDLLAAKPKCCGDCGADRSERYRSDNVILVEALLVSKGLTDDDGVLGAIYRAISDGYQLAKEEEPK